MLTVRETLDSARLQDGPTPPAVRPKGHTKLPALQTSNSTFPAWGIPSLGSRGEASLDHPAGQLPARSQCSCHHSPHNVTTAPLSRVPVDSLCPPLPKSRHHLQLSTAPHPHDLHPPRHKSWMNTHVMNESRCCCYLCLTGKLRPSEAE